MIRGRTIALIGLLALAAAAALAGEVPPPDDGWRLHTLARCARPSPPLPAERAAIEEALELFALQNGGDAVVVLEDALAGSPRSPWLRLLLGQIYVLAGQGEPHCLPSGGPARPRGDWTVDRRRCLDRAHEVLGRLADMWPDDGMVWFLRADAARAAGDVEAASEYDLRGRRACTRLETIRFIADLRDLGRKPAELLTPIVPEYPQECARRGIEGRVLLDLLIDPEGRVAEAVPANRADRRLIAAASDAAASAGFQAARVGYYPVWSWLEVLISFSLDN